MPIVKIPINAKPYKNVDEVGITTQADALIDGYIDEMGNTNKRPGLLEFTDLGTNKPVDGLYWWNGYKILLAVSGGKVFKIIKTPLGTYETHDITTASPLDGVRPTFAERGNYLIGFDCFIANGAQILYTNNGGNTQYITDPDAPTAVSHVAYLDQYILANKRNTDEFAFCVVGDPWTWNPLDIGLAEGDPDNIVALLTNQGYIYLIGEKSIEIWYNDGVTPFSRAGGSYIQSGCLAPYSATIVDEILFYMNEDRKICRLQGTTPVILSTPFDKEIQEFDTVTDASGYDIVVEGRTFYVLNFPSENRTIVYDYRMDYWCEWSNWNNRNGLLPHYDRWIGNCYAYSPTWGLNFVGSAIDDGKIYLMSKEYYMDGTDVIRTLRRSGHMDHGTHNRKRSRVLNIKVKRNGTTNNTESKFLIRFKDDGKNTWSNYHEVTLKQRGVTDFFARLFRMGIYRSRQYEIIHTDNSPFVLATVEEDVEVLNV